MADEKPEELMGYKEIGKRLRVSAKTVRRWDRQGLLPRPSFQVETYRRWRKAVIEMWIEIGGTRAFRPQAGNGRDKIAHEQGGEGGKPGTKGTK